MLLATCNSENELRLYRFRLDFEQKSIKLQYLQILTHFSPLDGYLEGVSINYDALPSHFQLSTLDLTPPGPKSTNRPATQASILASFLQVSDNPPGSSSHAVHSTVLCKWELETAAPRLHTCFNTLSSKKTNASSNLDLPVRQPFFMSGIR